MTEPKVIRYAEPQLRDPVAILGFPTVGLVGSIFAGLMIREMKLPVIAGITASDLPPYTFVTNGIPCPQIRIMAGTPPRIRKKKTPASETETVSEESVAEEVKKPAKKAKPRDIIIVTSEIAPKPDQTYDITMSILEIIKELGATDVICLEGAAGPGFSDPIGGVAGNAKAKELLESAGLNIMEDGIVRGISGVALMEGSLMGLNMMGIMVPANPQLPDPRAAARLVEPIAAMYPRFAVNTETLTKEAEEIDMRLQAQSQNAQSSGNGFYG